MRKLHAKKPAEVEAARGGDDKEDAEPEHGRRSSANALEDEQEEADEAETAAASDDETDEASEAEASDAKAEASDASAEGVRRDADGPNAASDSAGHVDGAGEAGGLGTVGSVVSQSLSFVATSAIGTANAAAAAVNRISDGLRQAAGNSNCKPVAPNWEQRPLNFLVALESPTWPAPCDAAAAAARGGAELCAALSGALVKVAKHREAVVTIASEADATALTAFLRGAPAQVIVFSTDASVAVATAAASHTGVAVVEVPSAMRELAPLALKYALYEAVLRAGCSALFADVHVGWSDNPFGYLSRDTDIEATSTTDGFLRTGRVVSVDDAQMGWSRYAQSLAISALNPALFYAAATGEAANLMIFLRQRFEGTLSGGAHRAGEAHGQRDEYAFTEEAIGPAHDGKRVAGVSVRVLTPSCFGSGRGSVASAPSAGSGGGWSGGGSNSNAILQSREFTARPQVLAHGCSRVASAAEMPPARPLNYVVPPAAEWPKRSACAEMGTEALCDVVGKIAIKREVLAAVSNKNIFHMLNLFINGIKAANVSNAMVVALDDATDAWLAQRDVHRYKKVLVSRTGSTDNHATSGLKFKILVDFLSIGCSVLLSDVDVIWLANPFAFLYRDTDVEGMTDGWDEPTSYGYDYGSGSLRVFARNSGMFYLQATHESNRMMKRLARRMETEGTWDQTAYNEEQFYPANGQHATVGVSSRVMNYLCNLNSKTFFRFLREDNELLTGFRPVSVHVNYHPEKPNRMVDLHAWYYKGDDARGKKAGIWAWNGGEGSRRQAECKAIIQSGRPPATKPLLQQILLAGKAEWGGIKWIQFGADGSLTTPWGSGRWGDTKIANTIFCEFIGQIHILTFTGNAYQSERCSDGEVVKGVLAQAGAA